MPNQLDINGLQVKTITEIVNSIISALQNPAVYGADINVESNSPDGQAINIFGQAIADMLELLVLVYNSFDVDSASGILLDQRVALNGITRKAGSFTYVDITIVTDRAMTLPGLDADVNNIEGTGYTVADDANVQYILVATQSVSGAGSHTYAFRARNLGAVEVLPNTIINQVTVVVGVLSVNNASGATTKGLNEETDSQLKARRALSFQLQAQSPAEAVQAGLIEVTGVTDAFVDENDTDGEVGGIDAHSIWCIVENGTAEDIAMAIYKKKAPGCGMTGSVSQAITRANGSTFTAKFDRPVYTDLYIKFTVTPKRVGIVVDETYIKTALVAVLAYTLGRLESSNNILNLLEVIQPDCYFTGILLSDDNTNWFELLSPEDSQHKFLADVARIAITIPGA